MFKIFTKLAHALENRTTYKIGILQDRAYRILKTHTNDFLRTKGINSVQWAMIGLLSDLKDGLRPNQIAHELGVEPPFITSIGKDLEAYKYLETKQDMADSRSKIICISEKGKKFVKETEKELREHMSPLLKDVSVNDTLSYLTFLYTIINNYKK